MSRVLFITKNLNFGGASKRVLMWRDSIGEDNFYIAAEDTKAVYEKSIVKLKRMTNPLRIFSNFTLIFWFCKKNNIKIICTNSRPYYILAWLISRLLNIKYYTSVQIVYENVSPFQKYFQGDKIIAVSNAVVNYLENDVKVDNSKIVKIVNSIPKITKTSNNNINSTRLNLNVLDSDIILTCIARFDKVKQHKILLDLYSETIKRTKTNTVLILMGYGDEVENLQDQIKRLNIEKYIRILPEDYNVSKLLSITNISILISKREGLSTFLLESISMGIPIIASNIPGNDEIVNNFQNGFLIDPNDIPSSTNSILLLIEDNTLREMFSKNSLEMYESKFDFQVYQRKILNIFK